MNNSKLKIAIDATTLQDGSQKRGIGQYVRNLIILLFNEKRFNEKFELYLVKYDKKFEFDSYNKIIIIDEFDAIKSLTVELYKNNINLYHCTRFIVPNKENIRIITLTTVYDLIPIIFKDHYFSVKPNSLKIRKKWTMDFIRSCLRIVKKLTISSSDITNFKNVYKVFVPLKLLKYYKVKIINPFDEYVKTLKNIYLNSDWFHHISESTMNDFINYTSDDKLQRHRVVFLGNNIEQMTENDNKNAFGLLKKFNLEQFKYFFYIGAVDYRKNVYGLIDIYYNYYLISKEKNIPKLLIIGPMNFYEKRRLKKVIKGYNLENKVVLAGYLSDSDLKSIRHYSKIFLFSSLYEGFGFPILEAMAAGIPVIAFNNSSIPEIAAGASSLVNTNEEFTREIIRLQTDNDYYDKLKKRGYEKAKIFTWDKCINEIIDLYGIILHDKELKR